MLARISIMFVAGLMLSGCIATPRIEIPERISFDYVPASVQPMSYSDLLCCEQCTV